MGLQYLLWYIIIWNTPLPRTCIEHIKLKSPNHEIKYQLVIVVFQTVQKLIV